MRKSLKRKNCINVIESKRGERFMNFIAMYLSLFNIILTRLCIYIVIFHKFENFVVVIFHYLNHREKLCTFKRNEKL